MADFFTVACRTGDEDSGMTGMFPLIALVVGNPLNGKLLPPLAIAKLIRTYLHLLCIQGFRFFCWKRTCQELRFVK